LESKSNVNQYAGLGFKIWAFAYGDPVNGLWMIILSCIVYGMAFDFFNISGSLFVETTTDKKSDRLLRGCL
jgi:hypothetical protein